VRGRARWLIVTALSGLLLALFWPAGADRIALLTLVAAALVLAVPPLWDFAQRTRPIEVNEHAAAPTRRRTPAKPNHLLSLERLVGGSEPTWPLPYAVRDQLRRHTRRRLTDHHRLDLDDPGHHARIASVLSPQLWYVVEPLPRDIYGRTQTRQSLALGWLPHLLDEIERL